MRTTKLILALVIATGLSGCLETDSERALAGAAGGAVVADAFDGNVLAGAAAGAAAGALCDDVRLCR